MLAYKDAQGRPTTVSAATPLPISGGGASVLPEGADRSGSATTTSGNLSVPANPARTFLVGQNNSNVAIGFNEFNGTAAIGSPGTYVVPAGQAFSISTRNKVNFIAATGTAAVTITEG